MKPLIRARLKPVEEMPEWAVCCEHRRVDLTRLQGQMLTVEAYSNVPIEPQMCLYCGKIIHFSMGKITTNKLRAPVELYDLDEGIYDPSP